MGPGHDLDALVAEKVMGWENNKEGPTFFGARADQIWADSGDWKVIDCPCYSTDIAAAWEVIEHLQSRGYSFSLIWDAHETSKVFYISNYYNGLPCRGWKNREDFEIVEDSAPLAICLAALKVME
jgi:hypothetical protein